MIRLRPHEVLGISPEAPLEEAKAAYRRLAQLHHPDREGGSQERFQEVREAYQKFLKSGPCTVCSNKGFTEIRNGMAVRRVPCPKCWRTP